MVYKRLLLVSLAVLFVSEKQALATNYQALLTEQSHPRTEALNTTLTADTLQGLDLLLSVDDDLVVPIQKFQTEARDKLAKAFAVTLLDEGRIIFVGSGSSGRAGIVLSQAFAGVLEQLKATEQYGGRVLGKIAGGARTMVKAKENFEDNEDSGVALIESLTITEKDVVIPVSASGSAAFNVGVAKESRKRGAQVHYFFNSDVIAPGLQTLIDEYGVQPLQYWSGPQAIKGSTRLQASNLFLLCMGSVLENVLIDLKLVQKEPVDMVARLLEAQQRLKEQLPGIRDRVERLAVNFLAPDSQFYVPKSQTGSLTYVTRQAFFPTVLMDTTEIPPTYSERPYVQASEQGPDAGIRAYVLGKSNKEAWKGMVPGISAEDLEEANNFIIASGEPSGCGGFLTRPLGPRNNLLYILETAEQETKMRETLSKEDDARVDCWVLDAPDTTCLQIFKLYALKTSLNLISNGLMIKGNKILGNKMIDVVPSNKKLVVRTLNLIKDIAKQYAQRTLDDSVVLHSIERYHEYRVANPALRLPSVVSTVVVAMIFDAGLSDAVKALEKVGYNLEKLLTERLGKK
jgi:N-acetylmuramic acid 6-phosphate (MurNAc-6-P) etherase